MDAERVERMAADLARTIRSEGFGRLPAERRNRILGLSRELRRRGAVPMFERIFPDEGPLSRQFYPRHMELLAAGAKYRERAFIAGNRVGKSETAAFECASHLTGVYRDWWRGYVPDEPVRLWACGKSNEKLAEIVQEKLLGGTVKGPGGRWQILGTGMIPPDRILYDTAVFKTNVPGVVSEVRIRWRDSEVETSVLGLKAYAQERGAFEGTAQHFVWLDEEPPEDVYSECLTRLATLRGRSLLTFTPLDGHTRVVESFWSPESRPFEYRA